ncbi:ribosomal RNA small subunit methyltransferase E [Clostridia bacterium]|nr:ribosomal RNA small subunit methyltransferase E [Clostridia bacterium]
MMKRLFVEPSVIEVDRIHVYDTHQINHIVNVLRMKIGDPLLVFDGAGKQYDTEIAEVTEGKSAKAVLRILRVKPYERYPKTAVTLFQGIPKGQKFDEIVRKATELGVYRIVPLETARVVAEVRAESFAKKLDRLQRIAEEASKQSRRGDIPELLAPMAIAAASKLISGANTGFDAAILLYELEDSLTLKQALRSEKFAEIEGKDQSSCKESGRGLNIAVFIGPEGGFEEAEATQLIRAGAISVTVGNTILRTETAGPAALAMLLYELEL